MLPDGNNDCRLRDCPGDEARISHLATNTGVKLVGRMQNGRQVRGMLQAILDHRNNAKRASAALPIKAEDMLPHPEISHLNLNSVASKPCPVSGSLPSLQATRPVHAMQTTVPDSTWRSAVGTSFHSQVLNGFAAPARTQNGY